MRPNQMPTRHRHSTLPFFSVVGLNFVCLLLTTGICEPSCAQDANSGGTIQFVEFPQAAPSQSPRLRIQGVADQIQGVSTTPAAQCPQPGPTPFCKIGATQDPADVASAERLIGEYVAKMKENPEAPFGSGSIIHLGDKPAVASTPFFQSLAEQPERIRAQMSLHGDQSKQASYTTTVKSEVVTAAINQAHAACFDGDPFPSAKKCQTCHPGHYKEWSVSSHAYAQVSPIFNAMSSTLIKFTNGTQGDFCIRCHTPVGMAMQEPIRMSNMDRHPTSREGVTCVVCHRVNQAWGRGSGRLALVTGGLNSPIYGPVGNRVLSDVLSNPDQYGVLKTDSGQEVGRNIHREVVPFFEMSTSGFCGACHDVFAPNGFRLEDAFSEYKQSPAAREKGQQCQDCHMGLQPGVANGFAHEPAAVLGNVSTPPRKRTNHMMVGPDYSIIHPGLFPHNPRAIKEEHEQYKDPNLAEGLATMREWLEFDYKAGWGTPGFESKNGNKRMMFPDAWKDQAKRYRAADILRDQFQLLDEAKVARHQILAEAYRLGNVEFIKRDRKGLDFRIQVHNGTDGHGVPTGFDAERVVFLRTTVLDSNGKVVFMSGDLDPNGDVRDSHSYYVHNGELPLDRQLFSLQTRFLTRNTRGGEREQIVPVPYSLDPLPYIRPSTRPMNVLGRPIGSRKHKQNLEANGGRRWASYHVPAEQLTCQGPYTVNVQLITGMVPINLVQFISVAGFDYGLSPREVADRVVEGHQVIQQRYSILQTDQ